MNEIPNQLDQIQNGRLFAIIYKMFAFMEECNVKKIPIDQIQNGRHAAIIGFNM